MSHLVDKVSIFIMKHVNKHEGIYLEILFRELKCQHDGRMYYAQIAGVYEHPRGTFQIISLSISLARYR